MKTLRIFLSVLFCAAASALAQPITGVGTDTSGELYMNFNSARIPAWAWWALYSHTFSNSVNSVVKIPANTNALTQAQQDVLNSSVTNITSSSGTVTRPSSQVVNIEFAGGSGGGQPPSLNLTNWSALSTNILSQYLLSSIYNSAWGNLSTNIFSLYQLSLGFTPQGGSLNLTNWGNLGTNQLNLYLLSSAYNAAWGNLSTNTFALYLPLHGKADAATLADTATTALAVNGFVNPTNVIPMTNLPAPTGIIYTNGFSNGQAWTVAARSSDGFVLFSNNWNTGSQNASNINATMSMTVNGVSVLTNAGNVTGSGLTSGNVITGNGGSAIQDSGTAFSAMALKSDVNSGTNAVLATMTNLVQSTVTNSGTGITNGYVFGITNAGTGTTNGYTFGITNSGAQVTNGYTIAIQNAVTNANTGVTNGLIFQITNAVTGATNGYIFGITNANTGLTNDLTFQITNANTGVSNYTRWLNTNWPQSSVAGPMLSTNGAAPISTYNAAALTNYNGTNLVGGGILNTNSGLGITNGYIYGITNAGQGMSNDVVAWASNATYIAFIVNNNTNVVVSPTNGNLQSLTSTNNQWITVGTPFTNVTQTFRLDIYDAFSLTLNTNNMLFNFTNVFTLSNGIPCSLLFDHPAQATNYWRVFQLE